MSNIIRFPLPGHIIEVGDPFTIPTPPKVIDLHLVMVEAPDGSTMPVWTIPEKPTSK